jgi:hypothetical protein
MTQMSDAQVALMAAAETVSDGSNSYAVTSRAADFLKWLRENS